MGLFWFCLVLFLVGWLFFFLKTPRFLSLCCWAIRDWSPQPQRRQGSSRWGSLVTAPGPLLGSPGDSRKVESPTNDPGARRPCLLTQAAGLWPTEPWDPLCQEQHFRLAQDLLWDVRVKNQEGSWWFEEE